ncbi:MAG TPA: alpha-ketoglutarate-dependent dioxygenase AlkB [Stellaceae bacterium]|jgi:alkylated DNA repair dioxygenase AlkB|nr:alpha-ketoglutarate-dependent dioxygenase AlkB [Stellaceae bacterium]
MSGVQFNLFEPVLAAPDGFVYRPGLITTGEEAALTTRFGDLDFREFEFHGYLGKRRTVAYGVHYDFAAGRARVTEPIPDFLLPLRERVAAFAGIAAGDIEHALVTEYGVGAAIGWHRDRPVFGDVIGVSLASSCRFRFRRRTPAQLGEGGAEPSRAAGAWERRTVTLAPRSAYILRGAARGEWEHSIPAAETLRYSVTFRTVSSA